MFRYVVKTEKMIIKVEISSYVGISSSASHYQSRLTFLESEFIVNPDYKYIRNNEGEIIKSASEERIKKDIDAFKYKKNFNLIRHGKIINTIEIPNLNEDDHQKIREQEILKFNYCYSDEQGFFKFFNKSDAINASKKHIKKNHSNLEYVIVFRGKIIK